MTRTQIVDDLNKLQDQRLDIQEHLKLAILPETYLNMLHLMFRAEQATQQKLDFKIAQLAILQQSNIQQVQIRSLSERIEGKPLSGLNMATTSGGHLNMHYDKMQGQ